jgi:hypothetical protein
MDRAEQALRQGDLPHALDNQAQALDALREGMRQLGNMLAQQQGQQNGQNPQVGRADNSQRDPLGRDLGANGQLGTNQDMLQGEDVYRRARKLLDEIRRRSGDQSRSQQELDYLKRLLEQY